ncbi:MAG: hypothetical protein AAGF12_13680 [Myxococcota bacterium]
MNTRSSCVILTLTTALSAVAPSVAHAQSDPLGPSVAAPADAVADAARVQARRLLAEAQVHEQEGRFGLAAERYFEMHQVMLRAALERASIALYSAGIALEQIPGREVDARNALQQFLDASTTLTEDPQVRDWRSDALEHVAELNARLGPPPASTQVAEVSEHLDRSEGAEPVEGGVSPVGPIVLAIGGAALIAGSVVGIVALGKTRDFEDACGDLAQCPVALRPLYDEAQAYRLATDVLLGTGLAITATGLLLALFVSHSHTGGPSVAVSCDASFCGATVSGDIGL